MQTCSLVLLLLQLRAIVRWACGSVVNGPLTGCAISAIPIARKIYRRPLCPPPENPPHTSPENLSIFRKIFTTYLLPIFKIPTYINSRWIIYTSLFNPSSWCLLLPTPVLPRPLPSGCHRSWRSRRPRCRGPSPVLGSRGLQPLAARASTAAHAAAPPAPHTALPAPCRPLRRPGHRRRRSSPRGLIQHFKYSFSTFSVYSFNISSF